MRCIFVMGGDSAINDMLCDLFKKAGYETMVATYQKEAFEVMHGEKRIDFVVSSGLYWKDSYEQALFKFGYQNVVVFTGSSEVRRELELRRVVVFEKPEDPAKIVEYIKTICPPK